MNSIYLRRGAIWWRLALGVLILATMVAAAIPVVKYNQADFRAEICRENLARIEAAKEHLAVYKNVADGTKVTMQDLIAEGAVLKRAPLCPVNQGHPERHIEYSIGAIGQPPECPVGGTHSLAAAPRAPRLTQ